VRLHRKGISELDLENPILNEDRFVTHENLMKLYDN